MEQITRRELRANLKHYLDLIESGEVINVSGLLIARTQKTGSVHKTTGKACTPKKSVHKKKVITRDNFREGYI